MKRLLTAATLIAVLGIMACGAPGHGDVGDDPDDGKADIYGEYDRRNVDDPDNDPRLVQAAQSVGVLVRRNDLQERGGGASYRLLTESFSDYDYCPDEPFFDDHFVGFCTAWLAGPRTLITNSHCVPNQDTCENAAIVFDHQSGTDYERINSDDVYFCERLLYETNTKCWTDFAVLQLDRTVVDRAPLTINREELAEDAELALIGHPIGMPKQIASGGEVIETESSRYITDLDGTGGNSGSPVLNVDTGLVEALHMCGSKTRFETVEVEGETCERESRCESIDRDNEENRCTGAIDMRISRLADFVGHWYRTEEVDLGLVEASARLERTLELDVLEEVQAMMVTLVIRPFEPLEPDDDLEWLTETFNVYLRHDEEPHEERYVEFYSEFHEPVYYGRTEITEDGSLLIENLITDYQGELAAGQWHLTLDNSQDSYEYGGELDTRDIVVEQLRLTVITPSMHINLGLDDEDPDPEPEPPFVTFQDDANSPIPDAGSVERTLEVTSERTITELQLSVEIEHTFRGDVGLTLVHPSGREIEILATADDERYDIYESFDVPELIGMSAHGSWTLRVTDADPEDSGTLLRWSLGFIFEEQPEEPQPLPVVAFRNDETIEIPDLGEAASTVLVDDSRPAERLELVVDIEHPRRGDVSMLLEHGASGEVYVVREADDDPTANFLAERFPIAGFESLNAEGTWTLYVFDEEPGDFGTLRGWAIEATFELGE